MKNLYLILFLFLSGLTFGQKYLELVPIKAPDSAGCGGKIKAIFHGAVIPLESTWEYYTTQTSDGGMIINNLCDNVNNTVSFIDSSCSNLESQLKLHADTTQQITLDTILFTMPSAPGMCDAQVELRFRNVLPTDNPSYGTGVVNGNITSYFLNNFCENVWSFSISRNAIEEIKVSLDIRINPPSPCYHFDEGITVNTPSTTTFCNGQIISNPVGGSGQPFYYTFISSSGLLMNGNPNQNQVSSICQGPYLVDISNDGNIMWKRKILFIWADDAGYLTWNEPDSILPFTDTISLQALANCSADYNVGIDTAFISSIIGTGVNQYDFGISLIQGLDTVTSYGSALVDTSSNFFLDMTIYCGDSLRSGDSYSGSRNLIYHGVKLSTNKIDELDNFNSIKIFPNPFESNYTLEFDLKKEEQITFELTDISGKIISSRNYSGNNGKNRLDFDFPGLSNGLYLLRIISENGQSVSKKVIKN